MKNLIMIILCSFPLFASSQEIKATTDDGKKVILKSDFTWEYSNSNSSKENSCVVEKGFKEPKWNKSSMYKRGGMTVDDLKTHISVDMEVEENDIILLSISEQLGNGVYVLCVNGTKTKYKRTGSVFRRDGENVMNLD